jgi:hypothetical protein
MITNSYKKVVLAGLVGFAAMLASGVASAANWLMVQGTEPEGSADLARVWGFVQVQYQKDQSDPNPAGGYIPPKLIGPNLDSQSAFNVNRARIGVRGVAMPLGDRCQPDLQPSERSQGPGRPVQVSRRRGRPAGYPRLRLHQLHLGHEPDAARAVSQQHLHAKHTAAAPATRSGSERLRGKRGCLP